MVKGKMSGSKLKECLTYKLDRGDLIIVDKIEFGENGKSV